MRIVLVLLLAIAAPEWWRETNSHAASARAERAYAEKQYATAAEGFGRAQQIDATPRGAFNLGTARIAAGAREEGAAALEMAFADPSLRADALFNRGNSALAAKALDQAIGDYVGALRANPRHAAAKRNLEIALARRASAERASSGGQQQQSGGKQQQQPSPSEGGERQPGQIDLDALLRSVQQQEQEELRRMKGRAGEARVGW